MMKRFKMLSLFLAVLVLLSGCAEIIGEPIGGDWRTWRGYSNDISLTPQDCVTFSRFDSELNPGCVGFAMYDAGTGARIGTIVLSEEDTQQLPGSVTFLAEDRDEDGVAEIGIPLEDGTVVWYRYGFADTWQENILEVAERSAPEEGQ